MRYLILLILGAAAIGSLACSASHPDVNTTGNAEIAPAKVTVSQVAPVDASIAIAEGNAQLVDVRTLNEFAGEHSRGATNIPLGSLMDEYSKIDRDRPVYLICESGRRSTEAGIFLEANGYTKVHSIIGGVPAWKAAGLPMTEGR